MMPITAPAKPGRAISSSSWRRVFSSSNCTLKEYTSRFTDPERLITVSLFVVSLLYLSIFRRYTLLDPDEGIILQGAQRILDGQVPYRDFFSFFTPGSYYLNSLVFRMFGNTFLVARTAVAVMGAALAVLTYVLARRVCSRSISLSVTILMTLTALPFRFMVLHNWDSTLLACLGLYSAVRWLEVGGPGWAFATGSFVSLTGLFEQSKGAGLLLGLALGFFIIAARDGQYRPLFTANRMVMAVVGLAWPIVITATYFASQHALGTMVADWFWPFQHYSTANRVPYGYQNLSENARNTIFFSDSWPIRAVKFLAFSPSLWIPILPLFAVALLPRLITMRKSLRPPQWAHYVLVSGAITGLLVSIVVVRPDIVHFVYLQPVFFLILAWVLGGHNIRGSLVQRASAAVACVVALSLLMMSMILLLRVTGPHFTVLTRRGTVNTPQKDHVIDSIQAHSAPGDRILSYPYSSMLYYLTATYSSTSFEYLQPGMHTQEQAQELLTQLEARPVRLVLYELGFGEHIRTSWPNTQASDLARDPVADYIVREYKSCDSLSSAADFRFLLMVPRTTSCP
jgi:4-amino-4-deoxy-L-arabinose transferase-like glycosyltransferase